MRVCVIGAGIAGLTCAYHLSRDGHEVVVVDRNARVGSGTKQRQILERIQATQESYDRTAARRGEESELGELYDAMEADFQEFMGWRLAEEILEDMRSRLGADTDLIHVAQPEIILKHLVRVVRPSTPQQFLLRRVMESNHYPSLASDHLRLQVTKLKKNVLARLTNVEELLPASGDEDEIAGFARMVLTVLKSRAMTLDQLATAISRPIPARRARTLLLQPSQMAMSSSDGSA